MVKSSDEAVVLVFNGCDEAVVKYFCVVTVIVSVRACVCVWTLWIAWLILVVLVRET